LLLELQIWLTEERKGKHPKRNTSRFEVVDSLTGNKERSKEGTAAECWNERIFRKDSGIKEEMDEQGSEIKRGSSR
jgi:hypothetical protein